MPLLDTLCCRQPQQELSQPDTRPLWLVTPAVTSPSSEVIKIRRTLWQCTDGHYNPVHAAAAACRLSPITPDCTPSGSAAGLCLSRQQTQSGCFLCLKAKGDSVTDLKHYQNCTGITVHARSHTHTCTHPFNYRLKFNIRYYNHRLTTEILIILLIVAYKVSNLLWKCPTKFIRMCTSRAANALLPALSLIHMLHRRINNMFMKAHSLQLLGKFHVHAPPVWTL